MDEIKLKPCPFCGSKAVVQPFMGYWAVTCSGCGGSVVGKYDKAKEAIKVWNRRVTDG